MANTRSVGSRLSDPRERARMKAQGRGRVLGAAIMGLKAERERALAAANARRKWRANTLKWGMALPGRAARGAYGLGAAGVEGLRSLSLLRRSKNAAGAVGKGLRSLSLLRRSKNAAGAAGRGVAAAGLGALGLGAMGLGALGKGAAAAGRGVYGLGAAGLTKTRSALRGLGGVIAGDRRLNKYYKIGKNGQPELKEGVNEANVAGLYRGTGSWFRDLARGKFGRLLTKNANTRVAERVKSGMRRQTNRLQRLRNSAGSFGSSAPGAPGAPPKGFFTKVASGARALGAAVKQLFTRKKANAGPNKPASSKPVSNNKKTRSWRSAMKAGAAAAATRGAAVLTGAAGALGKIVNAGRAIGRGAAAVPGHYTNIRAERAAREAAAAVAAAAKAVVTAAEKTESAKARSAARKAAAAAAPTNVGGTAVARAGQQVATAAKLVVAAGKKNV